MRPLARSASSLVAAGAPTPPALSINLPQASPCGMADFELLHRMQTVPLRFSAGAFLQTWEPGSLVAETIVKAGGKIFAVRGIGERPSYAFEGKGWFATMHCYQGSWDLEVAATSSAEVARIIDFVTELAGEPDPLDEDEVAMTVWTENLMTGGGAARYATMRVGRWDEVAHNYPARTRAALERLSVQLPPASEGGLVTFCGLQGSGKTRAIEALAAAWAREAEIGVVVDADRLLSNASYLTDVIIRASADRRQVIVVEDCDSMIANGPKAQETSKLLNIADGIVGRLAGAGTLFVLTANLQHKDLAPYVTRSGRAVATVEFEAFDTDGATEWLSINGYEGEPPEVGQDGIPLSDLYSFVREAA